MDLCIGCVKMIQRCVLFLTFCHSMGSRYAAAPTVQLSTGARMSAIALGTYTGAATNDTASHRRPLSDVVGEAIDCGYRNFDTASVYGTEMELGEGIRRKIKEGVIKRKDVFVTTKLWNTDHRKDQVEPAIRKSLQLLGLDYVDLYLMHWPMGLNEDYTPSDEDYMETWRAMEVVQRLGLAKAIGVSNFNMEQLERVLHEGNIKPAVLQIEVHPQIAHMDLVNYAQSQGLVVMGYSPLGTLVRRFGVDLPGPKIDHPVLVQIAEKYGKTVPQVVLRWLVDRNIVPVTKTITSKRLHENIDIFDFYLDEEDIEKINSFDTKTRINLPSFWQNHKYYPFDKIQNPIENPFLKSNKS